jgi:hypothetical protein
MVSIYYQNGGKWVGSRKHTFELAKDITGGIEFGLSDLVSRFSSEALNSPHLSRLGQGDTPIPCLIVQLAHISVPRCGPQVTIITWPARNHRFGW